MKLLLVRFAYLTICLVIVSFATDAPSQPCRRELGIVVLLEGAVLVRKAGEPQLRPVTKGDIICEEDQVVRSKGGKIELKSKTGKIFEAVTDNGIEPSPPEPPAPEPPPPEPPPPEIPERSIGQRLVDVFEYTLQWAGLTAVIGFIAFIPLPQATLGVVVTLLAVYYPTMKYPKGSVGTGEVSAWGLRATFRGGIKFALAIVGILLVVGAVLEGNEGKLKREREAMAAPSQAAP